MKRRYRQADAGGRRRAGLMLTVLPVSWWLGTVLQVRQRALDAPATYGMAVILALGLTWLAVRFRSRRHITLLWLLVGLLGAWGAAGWRAHLMVSHALDPVLEGRDLQITGIVSQMAQQTNNGWRLMLDVEQAFADDVPVSLPPRVQLAWYAGWGSSPGTQPAALTGAIEPGQRWRLTARLRAPHGNFNPHGFDAELWLWQKRIAATGYVRDGARDPPPELLAAHVGHRIERARQTVRDRIMERLGDEVGGSRRSRAGIVAALVTGDQRAIEGDDWDLFRVTGVAHLVVISGLHITMFGWLAAGLVGGLWRRSARWSRWRRFNPCLRVPAPTAAWIGGLLLATGYAVFSGWGVPAQRVVLMLLVVTVLRLAGLRWPWWLAWLWAGAVVLAVDPWACLTPGFWLSFVAVGILFATDVGGGPPRSVGARLTQLLRAQVAITLALSPLTLLVFGQASVVGVVANLVAIPWVTLVVTPAALVGVLWPLLWQLTSVALIPLLALLRLLASMPGAQLTLPTVPLAAGVLAVAGGILLAQRWPLALRLAGLPLVLPLLLWQPGRPAPGEFGLMAVDIGQGNAVLVRTARHTLLYDAGPRYSSRSDAGERVLVPLLRALGERLDLMVLSHRDADHTGGAAAVVSAYPKARVLASLASGDVLRGVPPGEPCLAGMRWHWDGVDFEVLHPDAGQIESARSSNAISCVLKVTAAGGSALLAGDIERPQEEALVAAGADLGSDLLLAPHHGSRTSSSGAFLDTVRPRLALVQSGYRNRYGHPAPDVITRYAERRIQVFESPRCGAMHWRSRDPANLYCERELARRYWHRTWPDTD